MPDTLNNLVIPYTLTKELDYTIPAFTSGSLCCVIDYFYMVNNRLGWMLIKEWNSKSRTFTFKSNDL